MQSPPQGLNVCINFIVYGCPFVKKHPHGLNDVHALYNGHMTQDVTNICQELIRENKVP